MADKVTEISIVLPVYNGADYLSDSIQSCVEQTFPDWELIIVNDASTDESLKIAQDWAQKDNRIRIVDLEVNRRLPGALNAGFEEAKGTYLTWTSHDNLYRPEALEILHRALSKSEKDVGLIYADYTLIDPQGAAIEPVQNLNPEYLLVTNCVGSCFLYRASAAREIGGYDPAYDLVEDYEYWLRLGARYKLQHLAQDLYFHRQHPATLTVQSRRDILRATTSLQREYLRRTPNLPRAIRALVYINIWRRQPSLVFYLCAALFTAPDVIFSRLLQKIRHRRILRT